MTASSPPTNAPRSIFKVVGPKFPPELEPSASARRRNATLGRRSVLPARPGSDSHTSARRSKLETATVAPSANSEPSVRRAPHSRLLSNLLAGVNVDDELAAEAAQARHVALGENPGADASPARTRASARRPGVRARLPHPPAALRRSAMKEPTDRKHRECLALRNSSHAIAGGRGQRQLDGTDPPRHPPLFAVGSKPMPKTRTIGARRSPYPKEAYEIEL